MSHVIIGINFYPLEHKQKEFTTPVMASTQGTGNMHKNSMHKLPPGVPRIASIVVKKHCSTESLPPSPPPRHNEKSDAGSDVIIKKAAQPMTLTGQSLYTSVWNPDVELKVIPVNYSEVFIEVIKDIQNQDSLFERSPNGKNFMEALPNSVFLHSSLYYLFLSHCLVVQ